jgi:single-strand DNA-binding protein
MYQSVTVVGNLGADPQLKYLESGDAVCTFSVATSKKKKDGEEEVIWWRCSLFGKQAETAGEHLKKGARVLVTGELAPPRVYLHEASGEHRCSLDLRVYRFVFLSPKDRPAIDDITP